MSEIARHRSRLHAQFAAFFVAIVGVTLLLTHEKPHPGAVDLPALPKHDLAARKEAFFSFLMPIVVHHNDRIRDERAFLFSLKEREGPGFWQRRRFKALAERYEVDVDELGYAQALVLLKRRVDVIPPSLVLIQAAKESGWGRSRFAREGNALFGEWCFSEGCGMVPARRAQGRKHEVRSFDNVHDAVASYMDNINSHRSYRDLRIARAEMRDDGEKLSGLRLAEHLMRYSERGAPYVEEIRRMIINNGLESG
ncbi:MAG: glucosaminidase domain-containing protein [Woeseia sp.]